MIDEVVGDPPRGSGCSRHSHGEIAGGWPRTWLDELVTRLHHSGGSPENGVSEIDGAGLLCSPSQTYQSDVCRKNTYRIYSPTPSPTTEAYSLRSE